MVKHVLFEDILIQFYFYYQQAQYIGHWPKKTLHFIINV